MSLINQLLDLSKLENHQMTMNWQYGDIIAYTEAFLNDFRILAKSKEQKLIFFANNTSWETYFDEDKWHKIIFNLLSNAIKYTEKNGEIILKIHRTFQGGSEGIYLKVQDNGIGIRKEILPKIFNRFYQVDGSNTRLQEGAGIGLALVKELVELQNGTITVQSTEGEGTIFEIHLPIPQNLNETLKINDKSIPKIHDFSQDIPIVIPIGVNEKTPKSIETEALQILIIEDNSEMRDYLKSCLDTAKYKIIEAKDGQEGIEKATEIIPDLIISDVMMPHKDGFEVVTAIRQHVATSHIPVVLLTAKTALESRLEGLRRGADAYLTKPFSPKELVARIEQLIKIRQLLQQRYQSNNDNKTATFEAKVYEQEDAFISELRNYILQNISETQLSVTVISEHFFMSRTQLYRKVKALTNDNMTNFITKIRLEFALELMENKQLSLSEIAYDAGFSSPSYFSTAFRRVYGKSPSKVT
ncbi:MAG: response regulator [Saprospiraceae bacterium]|nr:response regulator [Saprospiraceae bacterium]